MTATFSRSSIFSANSNFDLVKFGRDGLITELELNELQEMQNYRRKLAMSYVLSNGFLTTPTITYESGTLTLPAFVFVYNGEVISIGNSSTLSGLSDGDFIYLSISSADVTKDSTIKTYGNLSGSNNLSNYLLDSAIGIETTRRTQIQVELTKTLPTYYLIVGSISAGSFTDGRVLAEIIKNSYKNVVVGATTLSPASSTGSLTFVAGTNVTLTPNAGAHSITISVPTIGATDHGNLTGLSDDDHTQYMSITTARTVTAQHTFNPSSAGVPFILGANAQGQLVTGLNSDKLDGYHSSDFSLAGHTHATGAHTHTKSEITDFAHAVVSGSHTASGLSTGQVLRASGSSTFAWSAIQASDLPTGIDAVKIGGGAVSNTEFGYLDGVTSGIQSQIDNKLSASTNQNFTITKSTPQISLNDSGSGSYDESRVYVSSNELNIDLLSTGNVVAQSLKLKSTGLYLGTNVVWTAGNDGTGSGMDADTVDGYHAGTTAGKVLVLDGSAYVPTGNLPTIPISKFPTEAPSGSATYTVAANNSVSAGKSLADYICDGTADEVQINQAITAANSAGGGRVVLLEGTYNISASVVMKSNVILEGQGRGTCIKPVSGYTSVGIIGDGSAVITGVTVKNLFIDGNSKTGTGNVHGVYFQTTGSSKITVSDCFIESVKNAGVLFYKIQKATIRNNYIYNTGYDGIYVDQGYHILINGNTLDTNGEYGVNIVTTVAVSMNITVSNNLFLNVVDKAIYFSGVLSSGAYLYASNIIGNTIYGGKTGIQIFDGNIGNITGNIIYNATEYGIYLSGSSTHFSVNGNYVVCTSSGDYSIYINSNATSNNVSGNFFGQGTVVNNSTSHLAGNVTPDSEGGLRNIKVSTSEASGGEWGDIWIKYTA